MRWRSLGLLGGAPKAQEDDKTKDVDEMGKFELMPYAKKKYLAWRLAKLDPVERKIVTVRWRM